MAQPKIEGVGHGIPRTLYASDGSNWYAILVDSDGHVKIDVVTTALPTDAAKETKQDTMITALQLIDDLRNALGSVNTDDLQVDVKTSPLPTDAAKETKQDTMITALQLIDDLRNALGSVNTDDLQVDIKTSALPTDAATQTTLASCLTALQLIDDLRNALGSVNTDDLQVDVKTYPGSNVLGNFPLGYYDTYHEAVQDLAATAGSNLLFGTAVPAGEVWVLTTFHGFNNTTAAGRVAVGVYVAGANKVSAETTFLTPTRTLNWSGVLIAKEGEQFSGWFGNCVNGDDLYARFSGYKMKVA